ncbi:Vacuolar protein sorting-associated protein 13 [Friedmanniomyces endolithicus]|nr:Vacuolar protein sorting-associated protein 13 [Friedmanniomyces endolithicus]KAK0824483.1 Vacuolar protein sorting-associated protein 13 [Friedmanniomyces endolithicus]
MLEGLVANLLNRVLGMYVRNFDPKQLNVGIWSGDVTLRNLELRREALDQFHLPLNVVEGHISSLVLKIPWSNLRGQPVRINIEDVFLLAAPKDDETYDAAEEEKRTHAVKMEKLDSAELLKERNTEGMSQEEEKKQQSFTAALTTTIIDNVQIQVKNVHIRFEDAVSDPSHPFAAGLTLQELSAVSTDENWRPTWIQSTSATTHKLATLGALAVYWDTDAKLIGEGTGSKDAKAQGIDHDTVLDKFREMIVKSDSPTVKEHQYILNPVSGRAGLEMDKTGKTDRPKTKARLLFNELGFVLDDEQYRDVLMLVDLFHYFVRHQEYRKWQPEKRPKEDPKAWLHFAGKAVLDRIHDKNKRWSWAYFAERRDERKKYITLFKKKKREEKLTPDEEKEFDALEHKTTYEDLRFWRSLARNELRKENVGVKKPQPASTWGSYIWGGAAAKKQEETHDDSQMSEQQRKELYQAIDFDEKKSLTEAVDMPREAVKMQVDMNLKSGGVTLRRDPHGKKTDILRLLFDDFSTEFTQRTDSMLVNLSLGGMRLYDGSTEGNMFEQMLRVKDASPVPESERITELGDEEKEKFKDAKTDAAAKEEDEDEGDPFFTMAFEQNPLDGHADSAVNLKLKAMEIVYNPNFVVQVTKFFKPPAQHNESIGALMEAAGSTVEGLRQQTRAGLEYALQEHKTIDLQLDLQAPLIIVPDSVTKKSTICLILDAGHVSVRSDLIDKRHIEEIQNKEKQKYTEADFHKLEDLMYDKFQLKLKSTQVLIGTSVDDTKKQLDEKAASKDFHVVERINVDFTIQSCIIPNSPDLTKVKIVGHLPVLHAILSDAKYKSLMKVLDFAIPKFNDEETKEVGRPTTGETEKAKRRKSTMNPDDAGRARSKSVQVSKEELVIDEEAGEEAAKKQGKAEAGSSTTQPKEEKKKDVNPAQRNLEVKFTVDKLQGSLYKSDPEGKNEDQLLVDLIAETFYLEFYQRAFDMVADVRLRSFTVEDHVEQSPEPEFRNLISSEDVNAKEQQDLLTLHFQMVNKEHPDFATKYEGIKTNLDVALSTINLMVTRKTLLTLLDFALATFAPSDQAKTNEGQPQIEAPDESDKDEPATASAEPDKIRIKAELRRIAVILNNDGIRLATLSLTSAQVSVFLAGASMRVGARLGNLTLIDDINQGVEESSALRQLISIQGDELADFKYETHDSTAKDYPGYDTTLFLRSGSLKINFVTEPFRKIMEFGVKFGKMQAIFNAARQAAADQASKVQQGGGKMHFDVLIKTPIVAFPRMVVTESSSRDVVTAELGEIYASNEFVPLDEEKEGGKTANKMSAGIRNVRLVSTFHYEGGKSEELEMLDKVGLDFNITQIDHEIGGQGQRPDMEIEGSMSNLNLRITEQQMQFAMELSRNVPKAFALESEEVTEEEVEKVLPHEVVKPTKAVDAKEGVDTVSKQGEGKASHLGPELGHEEGTWTKLDLVFKVGAIGLELVASGDLGAPIGDLEAASLSKFSLNETSVKLKMLSDGGLESELLVQSFTITDTRTREKNKFRKIMSLINTEVKQQFMASVSISGGEEKDLVALLTVDSPRVILALDYLFAVLQFVNKGMEQSEALVVEDETDAETLAEDDAASVDTQEYVERQNRAAAEKEEAEKGQAKPAGMTISYRVEVVDAQVVLLANPSISNSEAIVLGTKQVLVSQQHAMTLQVEKVGMFLCRMDQFDSSQLRILDDFSIQTSLDMRSQAKDSALTSIHVDIEPLVLRLSLRDILLAMQIFQRASSMQSAGGEKKLADEGPKKLDQIKADAAESGKPKPKSTKKAVASTAPQAKTIATQKSGAKTQPEEDSASQGSAVLKREELRIQMEGIRVVLIGDLHELPILDWSVAKFGVEVRDWTGNMTADTSLDTYFNVYNFSKSAWEPLIEPWTLGFHMAKEGDKMSVEVFSRKMLELTVTSATIALASKSAQFLSSEEDVLSKPRGNDAPYRIRNFTGFEVDVWAGGESTGDEGEAAKLADGEERPWRFEDPSTTRETLSPEGQNGVIGVRLQGSGFDSIDRIPVNREGEDLYNLKPRKDKVQHRMLVEVKLGTDNVKYITLRSPLLVENHTQIPLELGIYSPEEGHLLKIEKIAPGEARPAPVGAAFLHSLVVRPGEGFGYTWSNERLFWKDLLKRPIRTLSCAGEQDQGSPPFYFQMQATFDKNNPLTSVYPYMRLRLSAPVEVQNLLPYDFKYRIYDKNTKKDWTNFLRKGGVSPVHVVELSHLLLMSVDMQDTPFKASEFAIINSSNEGDFRREKTLLVKDEKNLELRLKVHYYNVPDSGGAFKITIYAPYVILNRSGLSLNMRSKAFFGASKASAGGQSFRDDEEDARKATPFMFSFPTDDRANRALIKLGDSAWSQPVSFDAIGAMVDVKLAAASGRAEMHAGLNVMEGEGKYKLTKVVTITPRFIVKNRLAEEIQIREPGSSDFATLKPGELHPLRFLKQSTGQQLCLCFPGVSNKWSSPFDIANMGSVHVKLAKAGERQKLIRVEILMESAMIYLHLSLETKHWPFSIRNESDQEFFFWQANPNVDEDEEDRTSGWKPIKYRLPPRSIMPYAWDYPATKNKNLVLNAHGKERHIKLAEIGNLVPMRVPAAPGQQQRQKVIDLNVVAEGPTQTLAMSNYKPSKSLYKQKAATASSSTTQGFEVKEQDIHETMTATLRFEAGIGISLVNAQLHELIYVTWRDIKLEYKESPLYQTVTLTVRWIQIDNQLYGGIFPLIFYPSVVPKTGKEMNAHPIFRTTVTRVKDDSYGVMYIKYFTFLLQQMTIEIDEDFIFALLDFSKIPGASWTEEKEGQLAPSSLDIPEPQQEQSGQDIYFELLQLQPMQFDLSFVRTERINAEDTGSSSSNPFMFAVNVLTMSIGNVNDAPIRYNALMLENARLSVGALMSSIQSHYVQESLRQVHIVIGSADFLGNPVGLFNNISSGVADIFYEPYQGLVTDRPQDLGIGIAKGASSFVKKSVFGLSDSVSKFTGSISKGLAAASMDKEFQDQRRNARSRNRPKHALYGITSGGNAFASSLASGIGGMARQPMQGAEKDGAAGFVKGVGMGLLGLATKPAIGAFDLASNMAEGVKNTTTVFDQEGLDRVRYPRFIGTDGVVRPYSQRESVGQFWLKTTDNGKYFNEHYIAHLELDSSSQGDQQLGGNNNHSGARRAPGQPQQSEAAMLVIVTYSLIMQVRARNLTTVWDVPLKDVQTISKERTGMSIILKGGTNGPFVPIADEQSRNWLYKQVAVAVNAYNDRWNAKG